MGLTEIMALVSKLAGFANRMIEAKNAKNQSDFNTAWVEMQAHLAASNLAWVMAGEPPKIDD